MTVASVEEKWQLWRGISVCENDGWGRGLPVTSTNDSDVFPLARRLHDILKAFYASDPPMVRDLMTVLRLHDSSIVVQCLH